MISRTVLFIAVLLAVSAPSYGQIIELTYGGENLLCRSDGPIG